MEGGKGGYVSGTILISGFTTLRIYVGQNGLPLADFDGFLSPMTFNGGGEVTHKEFFYKVQGSSGGGATDVRLIGTDMWSDFNSLKTRIMVAAGGGGGAYYNVNAYSPGAGGGLNGQDAYGTKIWTWAGTGGSQTSGGIVTTEGLCGGFFGKGGAGRGANSGNDGGAGGGSGYYGGSGGITDSGSGGSSFISGYPGCNAIAESSTEDNIIHTGQANHYSGYIFSNPVMIDGGSVMPKPGGGTETGHSGDGYCIITWRQLPQ